MNRAREAIMTGIVLLSVLLSTAALGAAEPPSAAASPAGPGMEQLMGMADFMAELDQFSFVQRSGYDVVQDSGQKIEFNERRKMVLDRPDRFRAEGQRSSGRSSVTTYDGKTLTIFSPTKKLYASSEVKGDIDKAIIHFVRNLEMRFPLAMLLVTGVSEEFRKRVSEAEIIETAILEGAPYHHIAVRADTVDFQVWLPTEGDPLPRRIVLTYKYEEGQPQYWADFSEWNLSPSPAESVFSASIPEDARRIQFLAETAKAAAVPATEGGGK